MKLGSLPISPPSRRENLTSIPPGRRSSILLNTWFTPGAAPVLGRPDPPEARAWAGGVTPDLRTTRAKVGEGPFHHDLFGAGTQDVGFLELRVAGQTQQISLRTGNRFGTPSKTHLGSQCLLSHSVEVMDVPRALVWMIPGQKS